MVKVRVIAGLAVAVGCAALAMPAATRPSRPAPATATTRQVAPTPKPVVEPLDPSPAPIVAWQTDSQPDRGFAISYPKQWAPAAAQPDGDHVYYATQGAPAPLEMGQADVWLTVQVTADAQGCPDPLEGVDAGGVPAQIGGQDVRLRLVDPKARAVEPTWKAFASLDSDGHCYELWFVTLSRQTRARELATMKSILAEFKPLPAASPSPAPAATPTPLESPSPPAG